MWFEYMGNKKISFPLHKKKKRFVVYHKYYWVIHFSWYCRNEFIVIYFNKLFDICECLLKTVLMALLLSLGWENGLLRNASRAQCGHRCGYWLAYCRTKSVTVTTSLTQPLHETLTLFSVDIFNWPYRHWSVILQPS